MGMEVGGVWERGLVIGLYVRLAVLLSGVLNRN